MSKISWALAKTDYVADETLSYEEVAKRYGVSKRSVVRRAVAEKWPVLRQELALKVHQNLPEKLAETTVQINQRQAFVAKLLQALVIEAVLVKGLRPQTLREAVLCFKTAVDVEREALGLDKPAGPSEVQINFGSPEAKEWAV